MTMMVSIMSEVHEGLREVEAVRVFLLNTPKYGLRFCILKTDGKFLYVDPIKIRNIEVRD